MSRRRHAIAFFAVPFMLLGQLAAASSASADEPPVICSGQAVTGSLTWGSQTTYTLSVPPGQTVVVRGTVDIIDRDWTGGWQTIFYIDPIFVDYFGAYYDGPYSDLPFSAAWTNNGPSTDVTLTVHQEAGSHINYEFIAEVSGDPGCGAGGGGGGGTNPGPGSGGGGIGTEPDSGSTDPEPYDSDGDRLPDSTEKRIGTDPTKADTDGDGLLDPWEVPDSVLESGFWERSLLAPGATTHVDNRRVFDLPAATITPEDVLPDGRIPEHLRGGYLNDPTGGAPDPLHKDVYLEIDYQDCAVEPRYCPGIGLPGFPTDPMHHTPSVAGLALVQDMFRAAGIRLHIQLDEPVMHTPNCTPGGGGVRDAYFGTSRQRYLEVLAAKQKVFRWVFSGHSTVTQVDGCPLPSTWNLLMSITGHHNLPSYDDTPFGRADVLGKTIVVSLSPLWSCPRYASTLGSPLVSGHTCYRSEATALLPAIGCIGGNGPARPVPTCRPRWQDAGIFPAHTFTDHRRSDFGAPQSEQLFPGHDERRQVALLWARVFAHLLGQSLGIRDDAILGNSLDPDAVKTTKTPQSYASWDGLALAPPEAAGTPVCTELRPPVRSGGRVSRDCTTSQPEAPTASALAFTTTTRVASTRYVCPLGRVPNR